MASDNTESLRKLLQNMEIEDRFNYEGLVYADFRDPHSLLGFRCISPPNDVGARLAYSTFVSQGTYQLFGEAHPDNRGFVARIKDFLSGANVQCGLKDIVGEEKILSYHFGIEFLDSDSSLTVKYRDDGIIYRVDSSIPQKDFDQNFEGGIKPKVDSFISPATILMWMYKENYAPTNTQQKS